MSHESGEISLLKQFGTFEDLARILNVSLVEFGALLNENITPDRRITLLKELAVYQKNLELAFEAVKNPNTPDNQLATTVLQKLALKIQYCDMLAKGSVLKSEVELKREILRIANRALKGAAKQDQNMTTGHMQVVSSKADLVCTLLNQAVTQEAFNAMVKSNEANENVDLLDNKTLNQETNVLDDTGRHLKPEIKERFIREMSEFSAFMIQCGFNTNYIHKHLEAYCTEIEKKIINSAESGKPIAPLNDFEFVGRGSISERVAEENRTEMIKLALDQLKPAEVQKIIDEVLFDPGISGLDTQIGALIRENGVEILHETVRDHFNLGDKVVERLEYKIEKAWEAKGSLAVQTATHAARENFDIHTVDPAVRQAVLHSFSEKSLKEAGLCNHLRPDQSGVNRMCLLLSREVSSASAFLVESTTNEIVRRQSAAAEAKQIKAAPLDLSKVTRQRSMSTPQPPSARLQEGPSENKDAIPRGVETVQREMIKPRQDELRSEARPRSQSNAAPVIKKVVGARPTKMPTQAPPETPTLPAASWARPQGEGPKQSQETSQTPKKDETHGQSDNNTATKKF